jgi:hypothetical protein
MTERISLPRRRILVRAVFAAGSGALGLCVGARDAAAQKSSKASLLYQDHPHGGRRCGECKFFSPGADATQAGTCAIVDGPIQPDGWCMAFSPRQ